MNKKQYAIDMCNGALAPKIILFAVPVILSSILQLLFNAADVAVVGKFVGDTSQAAVTSTTQIINLLVNTCAGLSTGVNVIVARALGGGERSRIDSVVHTSVTLGLVSGLLLGWVGEFFAPQLLQLLGTPENVFPLSLLYLRIYFLGVPACVLYNFCSALLRAQGDTKRPMYFLTFAGILNVAFNLIFVILLHWDVAGVAAATVISQYVSVALVLKCLCTETGALHLNPSRLTIKLPVLREILWVGLPAAIQFSMFPLAGMAIQGSINSMGETVMAGAGIGALMCNFIYTTQGAFCQASVSFTSQNYGAAKPERVNRGYRWCMFFGMLFPAVAGGAAYLFGPQLIGLYTNDPRVIEYGMIYLGTVGTMYWVSNFMEVNSGTLRGLGYPVLPMLGVLIGTCGLRILWTMAVFPRFGTLQSLLLCFPVSWFATGLILRVALMIVKPRAFARLASREG